jgi:hypothetical protein
MKGIYMNNLLDEIDKVIAEAPRLFRALAEDKWV